MEIPARESEDWSPIQSNRKNWTETQHSKTIEGSRYKAEISPVCWLGGNGYQVETLKIKFPWTHLRDSTGDHETETKEEENMTQEIEKEKMSHHYQVQGQADTRCERRLSNDSQSFKQYSILVRLRGKKAFKVNDCLFDIKSISAYEL